MQTFEYEALDNNGRNKRGFLSAEDGRAARKILQQRKLLPIKVSEAAGAKEKKHASISGVSHKEITLFTRQLSTMIGASAPIEDSLSTIGQQTEKAALKKLIVSLRTSVAEGHTLSRAMARHPKCFNQLYIAVVSAGEKSGALATVLDRLADHQENASKIRSRVQTALIYPAALGVTAILVIAALMTFVVPKVVSQFDNINQELPFLTRAVIFISEGVQDYGVFIAVGFVASIFLFKQALKRYAFRNLVDRIILRLPLVGSVTRGLNASRLARTLATLLSSSVPVLEGLKAAKNTVTNTVLQGTIKEIVERVEEGASLSSALKNSKGFPPMVTYMAAAGENSGQLDVMLDKAADYLESEFESLISVVLSLLEPAIIVLMGGIVASIVLAIMLPIMQLNSLAGV